MQGIKHLTEGPIFKQLFNLAMPIMATSFIQMAYSLINAAWVGRIGSEAVAAIGTVGILAWMATSISLLNKVGSEVSVGQAIGAKDEVKARTFASHNLTIALIISILLGTFLFIFAHPIINVYELNSSISAKAVIYLRIIASAIPFMFLSTAFTGIYNAAGRSKVPFYISGTGLIINIVLDPIFIFVCEWGTTGAAIATWISQAAVLGLFLYKLKGKKDILGGFRIITKLQKSYTFRILKLGLPAATLNTLFAFVNMYICRLASEQGGHIGLMTMTLGGQIEAITWNTSQGFSSALSAFISQNYAAGKQGRVLQAYKATLWITSVLGSFCTFLFIFYGQEVFSLFVPEEKAILAGGVFLFIDGYSQLFMMLEITTQGLFYGTGRTLPPAIISITFNCLRIPLAIILTNLGMGVEGIWWAISITSIAKGLFAYLWFAIIKKRVLNIPSIAIQ